MIRMSTSCWLIDAPRFAEFIDDRKNEPLNRNTLRTNLNLLRRAGVHIPGDIRKYGRKIRVLEYFLLRSHLYRSEDNSIVPHYISNNWSDYTKAWKIKVDGEEIHVPFLGKIAFLRKSVAGDEVVCHPESAAEIDKICVDTGALTFQKDPIDKKNLMYKARTCKMILEKYNQGALTDEFLQYIGNTTFGRALVSIGLARREGKLIRLVGDGLFLSELKNIEGDDELEKVARLILRKEQKKQSQVSSVLICLEYFERQVHPSKNPIGSGSRSRQSKRTKKKYEQMEHFKVVEGICSIDARVTGNVLSIRGDRSPGFGAFGAFFDLYHRIGIKTNHNLVQNFAFLSWYTDSLVHLFHDPERLGNKLDWPEFKIIKSKKHKKFILKYVKEKEMHVINRDYVSVLQSKCKNSELIDMNIDLKRFHDLKNCSDIEYCPSNVFISSQVPVQRNLFETTALKILQTPSRFKDSQGAFYYPDFRFLIASTLGLSLRTADQILAYVISTNTELATRLWFFPAFGKVPKRDRPDQQLVDVIGKPFDSITLNY